MVIEHDRKLEEVVHLFLVSSEVKQGYEGLVSVGPTTCDGGRWVWVVEWLLLNIPQFLRKS